MSRFNLASLRTRAISALFMAVASIYIIAHGGGLFGLFVATAMAVCLYEWIGLAFKTRYRISFTLIGIVYIILCFVCCYLIRESHGAITGLLFVAMVWSSDIGAFFTGKLIGGPKMSAYISPNKTWAGYVGAIVFPALVGLVILALMQYHAVPGPAGLKYYSIVWLCGLLVGLVGQSGDLLVSYIKRLANVKDTGTLIPGHGGLLDRVDGMMLSAPVFLAFAGNVFDVP